jgi:hypothetical protein
MSLHEMQNIPAEARMGEMGPIPGFPTDPVWKRMGFEDKGRTARKDMEKKTGKRVVSPVNYLTEPEGRKRLQP